MVAVSAMTGVVAVVTVFAARKSAASVAIVRNAAIATNVMRKRPRVTSRTAATGERQERRPRGERKERRDRQKPEAVVSEPTAELPAIEAMAAITATVSASEASESGNSEEQGARRRGRRGGRGRGERRNEAESNAAAPVEATETTAIPLEVAPIIAPVSEEPVVVVIPAPEPVVQVAEPAPAIVDAVAQIAEPLVTPPAIELSAIEPVAPQESFLQGAVRRARSRGNGSGACGSSRRSAG